MTEILNENCISIDEAEESGAICDRQSTAWFVLKYFEDTHKTESAFYLRFQTLEEKDKDFLKSFYNVEDDWKLFRLICKFWNVKK